MTFKYPTNFEVMTLGSICKVNLTMIPFRHLVLKDKLCKNQSCPGSEHHHPSVLCKTEEGLPGWGKTHPRSRVVPLDEDASRMVLLPCSHTSECRTIV